MLDRLIPTLTLWSLGGFVTWIIANEYVNRVSEVLDQVTRALARL